LPEVILEIAEEQGFDPSSFGEMMDAQKVADDLNCSLDFAAEVRTGFPSVFIQDNNQNKLMHLGGSNLSVRDLQQAVEHYL
jgi:protein-disulfide isomerase-like protein with CxxC motif